MNGSWPPFLSPPAMVDPRTLPPVEDDEVVVEIECEEQIHEFVPLPPLLVGKLPTAPRRWTVSRLKRHAATLQRKIDRQRAKQAEELEWLEKCRKLAAELEALETRTYTV